MSLVVAMKSIQQKHRYCQNYYSLFFVVQLQCVIVLFSFYILYSLRLRTVVSGFISSQEMDCGLQKYDKQDNIQMFPFVFYLGIHEFGEIGISKRILECGFVLMPLQHVSLIIMLYISWEEM